MFSPRVSILVNDHRAAGVSFYLKDLRVLLFQGVLEKVTDQFLVVDDEYGSIQKMF